jgi:hypothetical protein
MLTVLSTLAAAELPPLVQWSFWLREDGAGQTRTVDAPGTGTAVAIAHRGARDWSFAPSIEVPVKAGEVWELTGRLQVSGTGSAGLSFVAVDPAGQVLDWMGGYRGLDGTTAAREIKARYLVPEGVARLRPRLTGVGPATTQLAAPRLIDRGNPAAGGGGLPAVVRLEHPVLAVELDPRALVLTVTDRRNGRVWRQRAELTSLVPLTVVREGGTSATSFVRPGRDGPVPDAAANAQGAGERPSGTGSGNVVTDAGATVVLRCTDVVEDRPVDVTWRLDPREPGIEVGIESDGALAAPLRFPHPFVTEAGTWLVVPMNEGIAFPVEDPETYRGELVAYGGHGICMAFWGVTDGAAAQMTLVETADDAAVAIERGRDSLHFARPVWHPQRGQFGYTRRLRYVFFDQGGHVAIAKRYRRHAAEQGRLRTLTEKRRGREAIDGLVGAVNVWYWGRDAVEMVRELQAAGIDRILWSHQAAPDVLRELNARPGVLTSRYDIYQDAMNPANFPRLRWIHPDWTSDAWPQDLVLHPNGDWERGWEVETRDGPRVPCGVLCDRRAPARAVDRIGRDLATAPYRCRFIDTTTAAAWRECYAPEHPMTRSQSRACRIELLGLVSGRFGLVCGSETGHDAVVPVCDYFEGMLSLGPYRVPDSGRDMQRIWDQVPDAVARFQLGHRYRLPLWELVYHDCCVAQWYWGDYNNKLPAVWDQRDRFNALYGTPPMFMFSRDFWRGNRDRFARSYRSTAPIARATAWHEMTNHRFLTPDRAVQQTRFANGVTVTVNFGERRFVQPDGGVVEAGQIRTEGLSPATL